MKGEMHTVISSGSYRSRLMQGRTVSRQCRELYHNFFQKGKGAK